MTDDSGEILYSGGPYEKGIAGTIFRDTFCLTDGCYSFLILDEYGDGICCEYGDGGYELLDSENNVLASGGEFEDEERTDFCVPFSEDDPGSDDCLEINFNDYTINSYGGNQDQGDYQLQNSGTVLKIENNAWKSIALDYTVTPSTVIRFDFSSNIQGEIHGIGFDDNNTISYTKTFKVHGTQNWGILNYDNYPNNGNWQTYTIPVGQFYTGQFDRLFFVSDKDGAPQNGNSYFRNIEIYEGSGCGNLPEGTPPVMNLKETAPTGLSIYPNPAQDVLNLHYNASKDGETMIRVFNTMGQLVTQRQVMTAEGSNEERINVSALPPGTYILRLDNGEPETKKFSITRQ